MRTRCTLLLLLANLLLQSGRGQTHLIFLDTLTTLDDFSVHVVACTPTPAKPVKLPPADMAGERFLKVFYTWDETEDPDIVIMVRAQANGDLLYIDKNADNDLTDDGPPVFFPFNQDTLAFDLVARNDPHQRVRLLLSRALQYCKAFRELPDSSKAQFVDKQGNLNPHAARFWSPFIPGEAAMGPAGTFFFDDRVTVRRGSFAVNGKTYAIGLFDYTNNGLYTDKEDVLLVDATGSGKLSYDSPFVYALDDVFSVGGLGFRIRSLDPYGSWIDLEQTTAKPTHHHAEQLDSAALAAARRFQVKPTMWDLTATTLEGDTISLKAFRGKYLMLNFWGEWCGPCLREIPALVHAADRYPDSSAVQFLSFVEVQDLEKAKGLIRDSGIHWPQLRLDRTAREIFPVKGFPTNMLILPDGTECIVTQTVSDAFFDKYVH